MRKRSSSMPRRTKLNSGSVTIMARTETLSPSVSRAIVEKRLRSSYARGKKFRSPSASRTPSLASALALASPMPLRYCTLLVSSKAHFLSRRSGISHSSP